MPGILVIILWIGMVVLLFAAYHKIFNVVYFNLGWGCATEILWCVIGSFLLVGLWGAYWYLGLLVTLILLFIVFGLKRG